MTMMDAPLLRRLRAVKALPEYRLQLEWQNDSTMIVGMGDLITDGTVFAPLKDPDLFATVRVGERARTIEWPDPTDDTDVIADYCADALYLRGERQNAVARVLRDMRQLEKKLSEKEPAQ